MFLFGFCLGLVTLSFYYSKEDKYTDDNVASSEVVVNYDETTEKLVKYYEISEEDLFYIFYQFIKEANFAYSKTQDEQYVKDVAESYVNQLQYVPHPEIVFYLLPIGKKESRFDISAKPPNHLNSSACGIGQIIWRWHKDKLSKEYDWRDGVITKESLTTNISDSIDAKYIVFENYLKNNNWNYKNATYAYLGKNQKMITKNKYRLEVLENYHLLTQRLLRTVLTKEPKVKIVYIDKKGETVYEYPVDSKIKF